MNPTKFIEAYELAIANQNWSQIEDLMTSDVCVTFSNGLVHSGIEAVKKAYTYNFENIKSEKYEIKNVTWLKEEDNYAVYLFEFHWSGIVNQKLASGSGLGTSILVKQDNKWKLLTEHLGKKSVLS